MINRQLSRLLLCSILGSTTLISGCALVRKDSAPHQQLKPEQIKLADDIHLASSGWPTIFILPAPAGRRRSGGNNSMTRSWMR